MQAVICTIKTIYTYELCTVMLSFHMIQQLHLHTTFFTMKENIVLHTVRFKNMK
jgi:hypothetical protein